MSQYHFQQGLKFYDVLKLKKIKKKQIMYNSIQILTKLISQLDTKIIPKVCIEIFYTKIVYQTFISKFIPRYKLEKKKPNQNFIRNYRTKTRYANTN